MRITNFDILGYNFPHWKTQNGIFNLLMNGYKPKTIVLQDKKVLNIPTSKYRITPQDEYLLRPKLICDVLGLNYVIHDHDAYNPTADYAVILGARILSKEVISKYKAILNIHPGVLPGNRGLDNLKWSIVNNLPIGVTAHFIDHRIDMGQIIKTENIRLEKTDSIRDAYIKQRNLEQKVLIDVMNMTEIKTTLCEFSPKFSAVDNHTDSTINYLFEKYKSENSHFIF